MGAAEEVAPSFDQKLPILLVDDDDAIREALGDFLQDEGYVTHSARNGAEALERLEELPSPCVVILDLMMPVMDGREVLERLRTMERHRASHIVVLSAVNDSFQLPAWTHATGPGWVYRMNKPVDPGLLMRILQRLNTRRLSGSPPPFPTAS